MINLTFKNFEECKEYIKTLLEKTDYVCLTDVETQLENYQTLIAYRATLRNYFLNPGFNVSLPEEPAPIWK
jgi:hypothetical protein